MKIRKELGSEAIRELVERASERAQQLPDQIGRDPWPRSHRVISESVEAERTTTGKSNES